MTEEYVNFMSGDLNIEGILHLPAGEPPFPAVVICHPHPKYGGDMHNNVVLSICQALERSSIAALRFNFRGVGKSQGSYSKGIGEQEDVKSALNYLSRLGYINSERLGLAGYSFGTMVVIPVALNIDRVRAIVLISPVITSEDWQSLNSYDKPKLLISGSNDFLVSSRDINQRAQNFTEPDRCEVIPVADHFWFGFEGEISHKASIFFASML